MQTPRLTLDASVLLEYWKTQDKVSIVQRLLDLAKEGKAELAVTARLHQDVPRTPLAKRIDELPLLNVQQTGSVARFDYCVLGQDMLGDDSFVTHSAELDGELQRVGKTPPDWRDWDHLHAHYLLRRDVFLTWDGRILGLASELRRRLSVIVMTPEQYLENATSG